MQIKPRLKRERLFKHDRPLFRAMEIMDGENYHRDMAICWVAHSKEPFENIMSTDQNGFALELSERASTKEILIVDDHNGYYESGYGPIAIVGVDYDGWRVEPHCIFFPWASAKNKLRGSVALFQMVRYRKIGACVVTCNEDSKPLFDKSASYGVLHFVGRIPNGTPSGDEYIYSVKGKRTLEA